MMNGIIKCIRTQGWQRCLLALFISWRTTFCSLWKGKIYCWNSCICKTLQVFYDALVVMAQYKENVSLGLIIQPSLCVIFSCYQAGLWMVFSVHLSICPSVCHAFSLCPSMYHHEIFSSYYQWPNWGPCKRSRSRSKVKVTDVKTQLNCFLTITPVWIDIWWWNDAQSLMMPRWGPFCFSRSSIKFQGHTDKKNVDFDPNWAFPDCNSSLKSPMATKWCTKLEVAQKWWPIVFQNHPSNFKVTLGLWRVQIFVNG